MGFMLHHTGGVVLTEIRNIEAAQHTPLGRGKLEMCLVCAVDHRGVQGCLHIDTTSTKRVDEPMPHGIFIKVEANRHVALRSKACCASSCFASASSRTQPISSRCARAERMTPPA